MNRRERTEEKVQELFGIPAAGEEGTDPEFMQILQGFGVAALVDVPKERYGELATVLRAEGAVI